MKKNKWKYHLTHSFKDEDKEHTCASNLYQTDIYMIIDDNPSMQYSMTPSQMMRMESDLKRLAKKGEISDLKFGRELTVIKNENGMYEELKEEN